MVEDINVIKNDFDIILVSKESSPLMRFRKHICKNLIESCGVYGHHRFLKKIKIKIKFINKNKLLMKITMTPHRRKHYMLLSLAPPLMSTTLERYWGEHNRCYMFNKHLHKIDRLYGMALESNFN